MDYLMEVVAWLRQNSVIPVGIVFCLLVARTYWPAHKQQIERCGLIPLDDDL